MTKSKQSWQKLVEAYEVSSLSKGDFCKLKSISPGQFYYWCNKIRPDLKSAIHIAGAQSKASSFLAIKENEVSPELTIKINSLIELKFHSIPDPSWMASLIKLSGENE